MKKYQKRKRPPVKPRPVQSVAPSKTGRDSYDKLALVFTSVAALAAAVSCVIALEGQKSSDQATAAALKRFSQVADAGGRQAVASARIAKATTKQSEAALRQAKLAEMQVSATLRTARATEQAIDVATTQLRQQQIFEAKSLRPILTIASVKIERYENDPYIILEIENNGPIPSVSTNVLISIRCYYENCEYLYSKYGNMFRSNVGIISKKSIIKFINLKDFIEYDDSLIDIENVKEEDKRPFDSNLKLRDIIIMSGEISYKDIYNENYTEDLCFIIDVSRLGYPFAARMCDVSSINYSIATDGSNIAR